MLVLVVLLLVVVLLVLLVLVLLDVVEVVDVDVGVGVGVVDVEVDVGASVVLSWVEEGSLLEPSDSGSEDNELDDELDDDSPSAEKAMIWAEPPDGTVTTQKAASPAPTAASGLLTDRPFRGSMLHGRPLQPPPGHSILRP